MNKKSSFKTDLVKEQKLTALLDSYYSQHLKHYNFERVSSLKKQLEGVDVNFIHKANSTLFHVDEKAQLDYINEDLPTFAFEISYYKNKLQKEGWFYDNNKKTNFYALITAIYDDDETLFTSCKITLVNRKKLQRILTEMGLEYNMLNSQHHQNSHGKICIDELDCREQGYLFFSQQNKAERPLNLILKLEWLLKLGVAKRLV